MRIEVLWKNARAAAIECVDGSIFESGKAWKIYLNESFCKESTRTVTMLYNLLPATEYRVQAVRDGEEFETTFTTDSEEYLLNVRDFGAKGDGVQNDTPFIQAAIMACPPDSCVLIPEGTYRITSLFLKDNLTLELAKGAVLSAFTEREMFPVMKSTYKSNDGTKEWIMGTWEGDAMDMFAGILTGVGVKNVTIYGEGVIDGNASHDNWWFEAKKIRIAARPRMIFLNRCENVTLCGITVKNSPSWNIHPYFSNKLRFIGISVLGPKDSPNTDGLDPEACEDVEIVGCYFSVGDDCIAVKSGKIAVGKKYKVPTSNLRIRQCCMRDGHGAITLGSEMAAGVKQMQAKECCFFHTDRGLRIKTRRGRGEDAVIDDILFEDIQMDHVLTPFVINCFYFCDPDGHDEYVQNKQPLPVDDRTPAVKSLCFRNIDARNCHVAGTFFYGLPEQKIEYVELKNVKITFAEDAKPGQPAMMDGIEESYCRKGIFARNIKKMVLENIEMEGQDAEMLDLDEIEEVCTDCNA